VRGDGTVTNTPAPGNSQLDRQKLAAFSEPTRKNVSEVVVTGPGAAPITSLDDLSGREVFIRNPSVDPPSRMRSRVCETCPSPGLVMGRDIYYAFHNLYEVRESRRNG